MTPFRILFVCTGNVCRSPFAETLTRHLLEQWVGPPSVSGILVWSAGVRALTGSGMDPLTQAELVRWGVAATAGTTHVARQLDRRIAEPADLVLTAERQHRSTVVSLLPGALHRTFCLREFVRLLATGGPLPDGLGPAALARAAVAAVAERRGSIPPVSEEEDAVPDPFGREPECHRASATLTGALVHDLVRTLTR